MAKKSLRELAQDHLRSSGQLPRRTTEPGTRCQCGAGGKVATEWLNKGASRARWLCAECFRRDREAKR